ncbi:SRPBCC family protein [Nocardioides daejeonensis]|uniref:SRPBCC family protein n=1 Tax=Nocardioides daejeonensis TaxID=1046556 RepID=UPI000D7434DD|nr:SRPBCC family protein [Nocardioides daejeonensis]
MAMKLSNEFVVEAGIARTWELLNDLERVAPCLPGASITGRDGEAFLGTVKVKVGPIGANLQGVAKFVETDADAHTAVISMAGKDTKGSTSTDATMHVQLEDAGADRTRVLLDTDLEISGRMAQFGRGAIADVSNRLIGQFTDNLGALIAGDGSTAAPAPPGAGSAAPTAAPSGSVAAAPADDLNMLAVLGPTVLRQAGPPLVGLLVGLLLGRLLGRRGRASGSGGDPWADPRLNAWLDARLAGRGLR